MLSEVKEVVTNARLLQFQNLIADASGLGFDGVVQRAWRRRGPVGDSGKGFPVIWKAGGGCGDGRNDSRLGQAKQRNTKKAPKARQSFQHRFQSSQYP